MSVSWSRVTLGQLAEFRNGLNYTQDARRSGGLPIVGVKDFQGRMFVEYGDLEELSDSMLNAGESTLQKDDILFVRSNGNRNLIGRSLFVKEQPSRPTTFSGFTIRLRFQSKKAYPRFFAYLLRGPIIRQTLSSHGGETNISNLNQGILGALVVPLPPFDEQLRIASILSAYDDLIEVNRRRVAILEEIARRLFEEWFVHLRFPGHATTPLHDTPDGPVPEGWRRVGLHDVAEVAFGFPFKSARFNNHGQGKQIIRIRNIPSGCTDTYSDEAFDSRYNVYDGDLLVGMDGIFHTELWSGGDATLNQRVTRLRPRDNRSTVWLYWSVLPKIKRLEATIVGTTVAHLSARDLKAMQVLLPRPELQGRVDALLTPLGDAIVKYRQQQRRLTAARDLLLPRLLSGQLSVAHNQPPTLLAAE